ncbi:MAG: hypothetical protein R6X25_13085 [Candidatus Krumholzibacteriia bacterium]
MSAALAVIAGCSSDDPGPVGLDLVDTSLDTVLRPLLITEVLGYDPLQVDSTDLPYDQQQVLWLGEDDERASSILLNYDFDAIREAGWVDSLVTVQNISRVYLRLQLLNPYVARLSANPDTVLPSQNLEKSYRLQELAEPFDPGAYPGPEPAAASGSLVSSVAEPAGSVIRLDISPARFVEWYARGGSIGFMLGENVGGGSEPGLIGFAAIDLQSRNYDLLDRTALGDTTLGGTVTVGMSIVTEFLDEGENEDAFLVLVPTADVSTLHRLPEPPLTMADGFMLRTHVRSYPALLFDLSTLPPNVLINRARLMVANDPGRARGPQPEGIVVGELDASLLQGERPQVTLSVLQQDVEEISGQSRLTPELSGALAFNVTRSVQRHVNGAYEGTRAFLLYAPETFSASAYRTSLSYGPDLLLQRFWFHGADAPSDSLRPQLRITYTRNDAIGGTEVTP